MSNTPVCDAEGFEVFTREFGNTEVLLLDSARNIEQKLSDTQTKLEAEEEHSAVQAHNLRAELKEAYEIIDQLRSANPMSEKVNWFIYGVMAGMLFTVVVFVASYFYFNPE